MTTPKGNEEEKGINQIELDMVMYEIPVLLEELKFSREHLMTYLSTVEPADLFRMSFSGTRIAQHIGHLAYLEKQDGKRLDMNFSFKLDLFDEIFDAPNRNVPESELPSHDELMSYFEDIHETFLSEFRYRKKAEILYSAINRHYAVACSIRDLIAEFGYEDPAPALRSERIIIRSVPTLSQGPEYFLPICAN